MIKLSKYFTLKLLNGVNHIMITMKPMKKIQAVLCAFGLFMGAVFPLFANFFITWVPGKKVPFIIGCFIAGYLVGMFGFFIIRTVLKHIDRYYKKTLFDKLGIADLNKSTQRNDLLLDMMAEFEELINNFAGIIKKENERLKTLSITDSLTSLYNHKYFFEYCQNLLHSGCRQFSLLFCDIDHFKVINDVHGHTTGDLVLKEIGNIIRKVSGENCKVFRYGGEEFAVILENFTPEMALRTAEKMRIKINSTKLMQECSGYSPITISIGISSYPRDAVNIESLVDKADRAMYYSKRNGRNQCCVYSPDLEIAADKNTVELLKQEMLLNSVYTLVAAIDAKDSYTEKHSASVVKYSLALAESVGMSDSEKYSLRIPSSKAHP